MSKKAKKLAEPIRLRFKKLKNGGQSIYLDCYLNGQRSYEFLKLYLIPPTSEAARVQNANIMQAAQAIKAQRIIEAANGQAGIKANDHKAKIKLSEWLEIYGQRLAKRGAHSAVSLKVLAEMVEEVKGGLRLSDIDKKRAAQIVAHIKQHISPHTGRQINERTAYNYQAALTIAFNEAVREEIININPFNQVAKADKIHLPKSSRVFLTIDEVKKLLQTDCNNEAVKAAFLFSVFCGLRLSDIENLTWGQVVKDGENLHLEITQQKTKEPLYLPLSAEAAKWLPRREGDKVFNLPGRSTISRNLFAWAEATGIDKVVTFHTARHTFATMMLTLGADLYTTSKLLGHTKVATTEIYAKIINKKKDEAVNLANGIFG